MNALYSKYGYRAQLISTNPGVPLHWLFLPGGPGLGSESFSNLGQRLKLPGNTWYIDYPNDGSNQVSQNDYFEGWRQGLLDLVCLFRNVVIVAHSFSGMFVLSEASIEKHIKGLVLLNTSPNANWMQEISKQAEKFHLPDVSEVQAQYQSNLSDEMFKKLTINCAPYFFSESALSEGKSLLQELPYSHKSYNWAGEDFHPGYQATFIPSIPTLIIGGEYDHVTPSTLFSNNRSWHRNHITIECLSGAGHFSWFDAFEDIHRLLIIYSKKVLVDAGS